MPTYQYACPDCGFEFEKQQKFTDDPIKRCPKCGKRSVYRVVSKVAVTFKGSGWYITDSKSDKAKHSVETKQSEAESSKTDGKSDSESSESKKPAKSKAKTEQD
ncbi:MAG: zinc ribbon domain-containing protein [Anaerolineae bacterium]|nr:zinc ribbon domain-containing protein [Anaerolineae bacterium]